MALPAFASVDDLEARIGTVDDRSRAQAALNHASTLIRVQAGQAWTDDEGEEIDFGDVAAYLQDAILGICVSAAARTLDTPPGVASESLGDATITYDDSAGNIYLTSQEKSVIRRAAGLRSVGTLSVTREDSAGRSDLGTIGIDGTVYAEVTPPGQPIPWLDTNEIG